MKRIDSLLIKAKKEYGIDTKGLYIAFVELLESGRWESRGNIWDGQKGTQEQIIAEHETKEQAIEALNALAEQYPNKNDVLIFNIDYGLS